MNGNESCPKPGEHAKHMCQLKHEGNIEEMDRISANPKFVCNRCGANAECEANLCNPRPK